MSQYQHLFPCRVRPMIWESNHCVVFLAYLSVRLRSGQSRSENEVCWNHTSSVWPWWLHRQPPFTTWAWWILAFPSSNTAMLSGKEVKSWWNIWAHNFAKPRRDQLKPTDLHDKQQPWRVHPFVCYFLHPWWRVNLDSSDQMTFL